MIKIMASQLLYLAAVIFSTVSTTAQSSIPFDHKPLTTDSDLSEMMVAGIHQFLVERTEQIQSNRKTHLSFDFESSNSFNRSVEGLRAVLRNRCGAVDPRLVPELMFITDSNQQPLIQATKTAKITAVSWEVLDGFDASGILIQPNGETRARVILLPDADTTPEQAVGMFKSNKGYQQSISKLLGSGVEILAIQLVDRSDSFSGNSQLGRFTNQPHREWIYRQAYEVGRHIIGYELQAIFSAIDLFKGNKSHKSSLPIAVMGHGEGGLLALYAAALDTRIDAALVSGYFGQRRRLWTEPIYRNVFGLLEHFGDAELAAMCWPRKLVIEPGKVDQVLGPPERTPDRSGAAPGIIRTPEYLTVESEVMRAKGFLPDDNDHIFWISNQEQTEVAPFTKAAVSNLLHGLNIEDLETRDDLDLEIPKLTDDTHWIHPLHRQQKLVRGMQSHVQDILQHCELARDSTFWKPLASSADMAGTKSVFRDQLSHQLGSLDSPKLPFNTKARILKETDNWTRYEVTLDVWPGVFSWGILVVPKNIGSNERRPVVVCQHGLEGLPMDMVTVDTASVKYRTYQGLATRLAERGYVTFSPHNPYRGEDKFRVLQRLANPLGLSIFSIITSQHQQIVEWLKTLNFVDAERIGFYGLSYGGKTAMRVPALIEDYALSICSGDFNEWVKKNASVDHAFSYMFHGEYEMPEWDLGHTFNYAEMAALIAPRPFMVERGHQDGVGIDEWVAYEYAKVKRHYLQLGIPDKCRIEYFNDGHRINAVGTIEFLDQYLMRKDQ